MDDLYDLCVIGGGVNGTGIARDAAGRGLKVLLLEQNDLASATSSSSTKLIHGGLRYLENYEFRLVREALQERERLIGLAPHIIWPLTFVLPDAHGVRPFWMIRLGLYLYDALSFTGQRSAFPKSRGFSLKSHPYGDPLKDDYFFAVSYSDGWVQDSRLVVLNAMDAKARGANVLTRHRCTALKSKNGKWQVDYQNLLTGDVQSAGAKLVVNAAGPWVRQLLDDCQVADDETPQMRLVQGSHIIVPKIHNGDQAYMFQQPDRRIIFAIPYESKFTLIGTTETEYNGDPAKAGITAEEKTYLLDAANLYFSKQLTENDIVHTYSGVRPLLDDEDSSARTVTRDYKIHENDLNGAVMLSIFGGKITTFRKLSEKAIDTVFEKLGFKGKHWTHLQALPGGDFASADFERFISEQRIRFEYEEVGLLRRYARAYGTNMVKILEAPRGTDYGDKIYEREIRYLIQHEFALTVDDVIKHRSKLYLHITAETLANLRRAVPQLVKEITGYDTTDIAGD